MIGRWKKIRSFLAITVSAAMIVTAMPELKIVSHAAKTEETVTEETVAVSGGEETVPAVSGGDEGVPFVSGGDEGVPFVTGGDEKVPAVSGGDEALPVVEEPAISGGDDIIDPETFQTGKLRVRPLQTTVYIGQKYVEVAKIIYENTTQDSGRGFSVRGVTLNGVDASDKIQCNVGEYRDSLYVFVKDNAIPGKYVITLKPASPTGIRTELTTLTIHVVQSITSFDMEAPKKVYRIPGKPVTFQVKANPQGTYGPVYKPNAVAYKVYGCDKETSCYELYEGKDLTITAGGRVTIGKDCDLSSYKYLEFRCYARDYYDENNWYYSNHAEDRVRVSIVTKLPTNGTPLIVNADHRFYFGEGAEVTAADLDGKYIAVGKYSSSTVGSYVDCYDGYYTFRSNNKDVTVDKDGKLSVKNVSGRPVKLTAIGLDGKPAYTLTLNLKKKSCILDDLILDVTAGYPEGFGSILTGNKANNTFSYDGPGGGLIMINFVTGNKFDFLDLKVSVKGGKNLSSTYLKHRETEAAFMGTYLPAYEKQTMMIVPTSDTVEVTVTCGTEKRTYYIKNTSFTKNRNTVAKGEPKLTTTAALYKLDETQTIKVYVGKKNAGKNVRIEPDAAFYYGNMGNYQMMQGLFGNLFDDYTIDDNGYITYWISNVNTNFRTGQSYASAHKVKAPTSFKFLLAVQGPDNQYYAPATLTIKIVNTTPKTDYKLQTNYKVTGTGKILNMDYTWFRNFDAEWYWVTTGYRLDNMNNEDFRYYQKLTYTGKNIPTNTIEFESFEADLGKDMINCTDIANTLSIGKDNAGNYYFAVQDYAAYLLLKTANASLIGKKDADYISKYGRNGKVSGYLYVTYNLTTPEGYVIPKRDKVKISVEIPRSDWTMLVQKFANNS